MAAYPDPHGDTADQLRTALADLLGDGRVPYVKETAGIRERHFVVDLTDSQALALLDRLYHRTEAES